MRLLETLALSIVTQVVSEAIRLDAIEFEAIKQIALARIERRPLQLDLSRYPHLPKMDFRTTSGTDYAVLVAEQAA